ncbi:MAG: hypothetical protein BWZ10_01452 [candidate division BRC1 bacterium ADurb.BinA364]|nr:MAG: hypothetical protein BWZ10_01452 [candidate division BRC1 bacterium ADurb.BinA364]
MPEVFDFPRDIQPILDAHCVTCHNPLDYQGGMSLAGDRGPQFSHSYFQLTARRQLADGRNRERGNDPPRLTGSAASPLMQKILEGHHEVKLSEHEIAMVRLWLDSAAVYPGTYAALATGAMRDTLWTQAIRLDMNLPEALEGQRAISRRCNSCHTGAMAISPGPSLPVNFLDRRFSSEAVWNLSRPELSMALRAPLAKEAGGLGICQPKDAKTKAEPVFASVEDPDYRAILACAQAAKGKLEEVKRFDMPGFRPRQEYIREMQKYGILPSDLGPGDPIDIYATDKAYWESFWHRPEPLAAAH